MVPFSMNDLAGIAEELAARLPVTHSDLIGAFTPGWMLQLHTLCENSLEGGRLRAKVIESVPPDERVRHQRLSPETAHPQSARMPKSYRLVPPLTAPYFVSVRIEYAPLVTH